MAKGNGIVGNGSVVDALEQAQAAERALAEANKNALAAAETRLAEINAERETLLASIKALGGKAKATRQRRAARASNDTTLIASVASVLSKAKKPMSTTEIGEAVKAAGYQTDSENFPTMVAQSLSRLASMKVGKSPVIQRPERGQYLPGSGMAGYIKDPEAAVES